MASQQQFAIGAVLMVLAAALMLYQRRQDRQHLEDVGKGGGRIDGDYESGTEGLREDSDVTGETSHLLAPTARGGSSPYR